MTGPGDGRRGPGHDGVGSHELPRVDWPAEQAALRKDKIKVSTISLCGCWGCTLSILDCDERILGLLDKITILRSSLTDIKRIPERCAVGFVEGGVANEENVETLAHFRENCDVLISVGACAIWGGVPSLRNVLPLSEVMAEAYLNSPTRVPGSPDVIPAHPDIPRLTSKVFPCHEVVHMDYFLPGCPPSGDAVFAVLDDLASGRPVNLPRTLTSFE
jgi:NAD-reducing hydrogenase small subunit